MDVHLVVGEHEADPFVLADRLAKGGASPRIVGGYVVGAVSGTQPAHAGRQAGARWCRLSLCPGAARAGALWSPMRPSRAFRRLPLPSAPIGTNPGAIIVQGIHRE